VSCEDKLVAGDLRQLLEKGEERRLPSRMEVKLGFINNNDGIPNIKSKNRE
jgi:hypothetical protein